jgi:hypothetical protein
MGWLGINEGEWTMEKIEQRHRIAALDKIPGDDAKSVAVRRRIFEGLSDEHPSVQAAAFYERTAIVSRET